MPELFTVDDLIACYRRGVFPMADARDDEHTYLIDPERRGVIPLNGFHLSKRLARTVRSDLYEVRIDTAFAATVQACAAPRPDRPETWINGEIETLYGELFGRGLAHSVEAWADGRMVGGLYGVCLGGAFFGESMFSVARDASKVALVHLVARLIAGRFKLLDTQFMTDHLAQFGAREISRAHYRGMLAEALDAPADFYDLATRGATGGATGGAAGAAVLQAISHTS